MKRSGEVVDVEESGYPSSLISISSSKSTLAMFIFRGGAKGKISYFVRAMHTMRPSFQGKLEG